MDDAISRLKSRKAINETDKVAIGDVTLTVRALSRAEVKELRDANASKKTFENRLIAAALVDPIMTAVDVAEWLDDAPAGDSIAVMDVVSRLSGMDEGAGKSDLRSDGARRGD